jgi:hypothetical protein
MLALFWMVPPPRAATTGTLEIASKTGVHSFSVEVVATDAEREKGLMYRRELPEGRGMLFDFQAEQPVAFWMKNTYIPLDMIFIRGAVSCALPRTPSRCRNAWCRRVDPSLPCSR